MRRATNDCLWALTFSTAIIAGIFTETPARAADPTTADCLAASEASLTLGNEHKLRDERRQLLVCAAATCPSDVRKECLRRVDDVNAAIPTIIFEAKDGAGNDLSAIKVTMDGELLAQRLEGSAISIDPGEHSFVFETAGEAPLQKHFVIREAQKERRESIRFGTGTPVATPPSPATHPNPPSQAWPPAPAPSSPAPEGHPGLGTQRVLALVVGGVGLVSLGIGSAFAVATVSKKEAAQNACPGACDQSGVNMWNDAITAGNISTAFFIAGGVGLAGATVLWFTGAPPSPSGASVAVGFGPGTFQLKGGW